MCQYARGNGNVDRPASYIGVPFSPALAGPTAQRPPAAGRDLGAPRRPPFGSGGDDVARMEFGCNPIGLAQLEADEARVSEVFGRGKFLERAREFGLTPGFALLRNRLGPE